MKELELLIDSFENKPQIIAITEVKNKLKNYEIKLSEFNLKGYNIVSTDLDKCSRGIVLYIDKSIEFTIIEANIKFEEYILIKIKLLDKSDLILCIVYRSPNSTDENNKLLFDIFNKMCVKLKYKLMFIGDFNFPGIDWNNWTSKNNNNLEMELINKLQDNFVLQHVIHLTRARASDEPHALDLVISSEDFISEIKTLGPLGKSDHSVLVINSSIQNINQHIYDKFNFKKGDYKSLIEALNIDWIKTLEPFENSIDDMWTEIKNIINLNTVKYIPKTNNFDTWEKKDWRCPLPEEIRKLIKSKSRLWTKYIENKSENNLNKYKIIRNKVRSVTRRIIRDEQKNIAKACKGNPKKFWNYIKSKSKNSSCVGDMKYKNKNGDEYIAKSNEDKANAFCDYFSSVFTEEDDNSFENLSYKDNLNEMTDICFNVDDIKIKLKNLNVNKSQGPDNIHPKILKEANEVLALPLHILFETSFRLKQLPQDWKSANISAIFKKGSKLDVGNYRPVSLTCICCKIMESIIRDNIFTFFIDNKLFSPRQFGFMKGRSTVLQLLKVLDEWTELLESGGQVDVIYTDFEKAFDKVPHKRLISKLRSYKINDKIVNWIESFLKSRKQRVKINGKLSDWQAVLSGIPQGSILGPLLFIIYINDLVQVCNQGSKLYLYADDSKVFKHINNILDEQILQTDLNNIKEWSDRWLLKLNIQKCKVLSYGRDIKINSNYYIKCNQDQFKLEKLEFINDLGVTFDKNLKFDNHINVKIKKSIFHFRGYQ